MTQINNIYTRLASQNREWHSRAKHIFKNISSSYAAILQDVTQSHGNEPFSEIHRKVPFILSMQESDSDITGSQQVQISFNYTWNIF